MLKVLITHDILSSDEVLTAHSLDFNMYLLTAGMCLYVLALVLR